jgi:AraC-like DNA-binding protein
MGANIFDVSGVKTDGHAVKEILNPTEEPRLVVRVMLGGSDDVFLPDFREQSIHEEGRCAIYASTSPQAFFRCRPGRSLDQISFALTSARLRDYLGDMPLPASLKRLMDGKASYFNHTPTATPAMKRAALAIRAAPMYGASRHFYLQGKMLEILSEVVACLEDDSPSKELILGIEKRRLLEVCDLLVADLSSPPDMVELANKVGASPRRLNNVFKQAFGMTAFEWLAEHKMQLAGEMLQEGSLPIKEITFRLGYAHVSNFTTAFTKRYGAPPADYRQLVCGAYALGGISS